jgi:hypothetical protein
MIKIKRLVNNVKITLIIYYSNIKYGLNLENFGAENKRVYIKFKNEKQIFFWIDWINN